MSNTTCLLDLIAPHMRDDCIERTARKRHTCHTHWGAVERPERHPGFGPAAGWATEAHPSCLQHIEPGTRYLECMSEAYAYTSGSRYCAGCVSTGIPLGAAE